MDDEMTWGAARAERTAIPRRRKEPEPTWRIPTHTAVMMLLVALIVFDGAQVMSTLMSIGGGLIYADEYQWVIDAAEVMEDVAPVVGAASAVQLGAACGIQTLGLGCLTAGITYLFKLALKEGARLLGEWVIDQVVEIALLFLFLVKTVIGLLIGLVGYFAMWLWFMMRDVGFFTGNMVTKKIGFTFLAFFVGLIPFVSDVPEMTIWVATIILLSWREDKQEHDRLVERQRQEDLQLARAQAAYGGI